MPAIAWHLLKDIFTTLRQISVKNLYLVDAGVMPTILKLLMNVTKPVFQG